VRGALVWNRDRGLDQLDEIVDRAGETVGGYTPRSVKLMLDGVVENHTASMLAPYLNADGRPTGNHGIDMIDPGELRAVVTAVDAAGLQPHFHALGDGAVRHALDAVAAARTANGFRDTRPHLAHLQVIDPDDIPRFAALGATATIQPLWAQADEAMNELTIPFLGEERSAQQYPFGDLVRAGASLAMGSDWSVTTPDVLQQVAVAVNRNDPAAGIHEPFLPEQRLDVSTALAAVTAGSARVNHFDTDSGRIEPGMRADLVMVGGDPGNDPIHEIGVDLTMIGGAVVYRRPGSD
jgi:predicted amidohydrolase YtcJ